MRSTRTISYIIFLFCLCLSDALNAKVIQGGPKEKPKSINAEQTTSSSASDTTNGASTSIPVNPPATAKSTTLRTPNEPSGFPKMISLFGKCTTFTTSKFEYKICPFSSVTQKELNIYNGFEYTLGVWDHWGDTSSTQYIMYYNDGTSCNGKSREIAIRCECDHFTEFSLSSIEEPQTCVYSGILTTKYICDYIENNNSMNNEVTNDSSQNTSSINNVVDETVSTSEISSTNASVTNDVSSSNTPSNDSTTNDVSSSNTPSSDSSTNDSSNGSDSTNNTPSNDSSNGSVSSSNTPSNDSSNNTPSNTSSNDSPSNESSSNQSISSSRNGNTIEQTYVYNDVTLTHTSTDQYSSTSKTIYEQTETSNISQDNSINQNDLSKDDNTIEQPINSDINVHSNEQIEDKQSSSSTPSTLISQTNELKSNTPIDHVTSMNDANMSKNCEPWTTSDHSQLISINQQLSSIQEKLVNIIDKLETLSYSIKSYDILAESYKQLSDDLHHTIQLLPSDYE